MPEPVAGADQVVLLVLDGLGWEQLQERLALAPTLAAMAGRCHPLGRAVDHGDRADLDRHRPDPGRARRGRLPHRRARRGPQRAALDHAGGRRPPARPAARDAARARRSSAATCPVVTKAEFAGTGFTAAHLAGVRHVGWRMPSTLVDRGRAPAAPRASRSSTPTTTASTRSPTSTAWASTTTPSWRPPTAWSPTCSRPARRGAALVVTADHGQVDVGDRIHRLAPDVAALGRRSSRARAGSAGCTPAGRGRRPARGRHRRPRRPGLGGQPWSRSSTRAGSARA